MKKRGFRSFFKSKKGISPLIATVLLIAFAVALGAVVMNWGRSYVEERANEAAVTSDTKLSCASVNFEIKQFSSGPEMCYDVDEGIVKTTLGSKYDEEIKGITFNIFGADGIVSVVSETVLPPGGAKTFKIEYDSSENGEIRAIEMVPMIGTSSSSEPILCADAADTTEDVPDCS